MAGLLHLPIVTTRSVGFRPDTHADGSLLRSTCGRIPSNRRRSFRTPERALTGAATSTDAQSARGLEGDERRRDVVADVRQGDEGAGRAERGPGDAGVLGVDEREHDEQLRRSRRPVGLV